MRGLENMVDATDVGDGFKDADAVAQLARTLLERCPNFYVDAFDFDALMESSV